MKQKFLQIYHHLKRSKKITWPLIPSVLLLLVLPLIIMSNSKHQQQSASAAGIGSIKNVFVIMMENHNWSDIAGSSSAPYINSLLTRQDASYATQYYNPPNNHPSAPNYVWLEAGSAVAGQNDCAPTDSGCNSSGNHLSKLLDGAGIPWKEYVEGASGTKCILDFSSVDVNHVPFSYFTDVTNNNSATSTNCISHERPYTELSNDLASNTVARYNFITPNLIDDMHDGTIQQGDTWLQNNLPLILNSSAYKNGGAVFLTWDEGEGTDGPIGMILLSPFAKGNGYHNTTHYDHSSTLRTMEEIFGVSPMLGGAANATDLSDLFTVSALATPTPTLAPIGSTTSLHYTSNSVFDVNGNYTPGAYGFNVTDAGSVSEVNSTPAGDKALVYLGMCNGVDTTFISTVKQYIGNPKVFGFYLMDEPDPTGQYKPICPQANLKAESDWIHTNMPGVKTFIIMMVMSASSNPSYLNTYNPANSDIDFYGLDPYPCRVELNNTCDYSYITKAVSAAQASGVPLAAIVPVYQAFGGGAWVDDGGGAYLMPNATQEQQILDTWKSVVPNPVFDYAYSWGSQNGDTSLSGSIALQQVFANHNSGTTVTAVPTPTNLPTSAPLPTSTPLPTVTSAPTDTTPPTVSITFPINGTIFQRNNIVSITANATDNVGVTKVTFTINGTLLCTNTTTPYGCKWTVPAPKGKVYTITAQAYDARGNTNSSSIQVTSSR